ncbi:MAG: hypothetical protein CL524_15170, partial [Aequorivita sp.]|nr:hypothetical protein [Aequorivita sp.]
MTIELTALQQQRRDTAANWTSANPTLLTGEIGYETDTGKFKIGDGSTVWTGLGYLPIPDSSGLIPISQLLLPLGSASAPSLTFTGDANTGVYSPGADQLAITTAGTPRVVVDSSGKVGIGETDVDALLVIKGDSNATTNPSIRLKDGADTREAWISNASGDLSLNVGGNDNVSHGTLKLFDSGVLDYSQAAGSALRIDSSGRVGVGTTSPSVNLDISPASGAAELKIAGAEGAEASIRLFADQGDDAADIKRLLTDTSGNFKIQHYAGSAFVDSMVIDSSGDVKIADYQSGTAGKNGFELRASGELVQNRNGGDAYTLYNNSSAKTITFQASGSATFAGTVIVGEYSSSATNASGARITASGQLNLQRQAGASADNRFQILDGLTVKASITNAGSATFGQASNSTNNNGVAVGGNNGTLNIYTTRYSVDAFQLINTSGSGTNVAVRFDGDGSATFAG